MMIGGFLLSLRCAIRGILLAFVHERNMRIHGGIAIIVVGLGIVLGLDRNEWICIFGGIGVILAVEMINTTIENMLDLLAPAQHPSVKNIKDAAAGAVLVVSIAIACIGGMIFLPKIWQVFSKY